MPQQVRTRTKGFTVSFEKTLSAAVEDFKMKFAGEVREAMLSELEAAQGMVLDAHKALNEAETVLGVGLTPLVVPNWTGDVLEAVLVVAEVPRLELDLSGVVAPVSDPNPLKKVLRASKAYDRVRRGGAEKVKQAKRMDLYKAIVEAKENGKSMTEINRACKRSVSWAHNFIRDTKLMGLV